MENRPADIDKDFENARLFQRIIYSLPNGKRKFSNIFFLLGLISVCGFDVPFAFNYFGIIKLRLSFCHLFIPSCFMFTEGNFECLLISRFTDV